MAAERPHDLDEREIGAALAGTRFCDIEVRDRLDSTQRLLVAEGGRDGRVVVADYQTAGRGRAGRDWDSPSGRSLLFSTLLTPPPARPAPLITLATSVAVARALHEVAGVDAELKWPNDVLIGGRKVCGILGELTEGGTLVVVGVGINVAQTSAELPEGVDATSLWLTSGAKVHRGRLLVAVLRQLEAVLAAGRWMPEYRVRSATIGKLVRVTLPAGVVEGRATAIRDDGALMIGEREILAGDVVHLRERS